jgi:hypothetical protein
LLLSSFPLSTSIICTKEEFNAQKNKDTKNKKLLIRLDCKYKGQPKIGASIIQNQISIGKIIYGGFNENKARGYGIGLVSMNIDQSLPIIFLNTNSKIEHECFHHCILNTRCL